MEAEDIKAISSEDYLNEIIDTGWSIVGPRKDRDKDLRSAKNFFKRNIAFIPEHVLKADGFKIVPPSTLTRGHQLMYKDEGKQAFSDEYSTVVARAMLRGSTLDGCRECAIEAVDRLDFSALESPYDHDKIPDYVERPFLPLAALHQ